MQRMHIHVSVPDLDQAVTFYQGLFDHPPTVRETDYAQWQLDDPRVNFAVSTGGARNGLDHLDPQVDSGQELAALRGRLDRLDAPTDHRGETLCCYARSDKSWTTDPVGIPWESFHTLERARAVGPARVVASTPPTAAAGTTTAPDSAITTGSAGPG